MDVNKRGKPPWLGVLSSLRITHLGRQTPSDAVVLTTVGVNKRMSWRQTP